MEFYTSQYTCNLSARQAFSMFYKEYISKVKECEACQSKARASLQKVWMATTGPAPIVSVPHHLSKLAGCLVTNRHESGKGKDQHGCLLPLPAASSVPSAVQSVSASPPTAASYTPPAPGAAAPGEAAVSAEPQNAPCSPAAVSGNHGAESTLQAHWQWNCRVKSAIRASCITLALRAQRARASSSSSTLSSLNENLAQVFNQQARDSHAYSSEGLCHPLSLAMSEKSVLYAK